MEEEAKNNLTGAPGGGIPQTGITYLIPQGEQAVTAVNRETAGLTEAEFEQAIPDEERAQTEEDFEGLDEIRALGCFSPVAGMMEIPDCGNRIFARVYVQSDGRRFIEYREQYDSGRVSPSMRIAQEDLRMAAFYQYDSKNAREPKLRRQVSEFITGAVNDYFGKTEGCGEPMDFTEFFRKLFSIYGELPAFYEVQDEVKPEVLYKKVMRTIENMGNTILDEHRAYYALDDEQMTGLAAAMDMKKTELLKTLKKHRFLYLTESSMGYKTNVRFKGDGEFYKESFTSWCYCILKLGYIAKARRQQGRQN